MQSTTVLNSGIRSSMSGAGSHQFASAASAQSPRSIPPYVTPSATPSLANSSSPERRRRIEEVPGMPEVPYCRVHPDSAGDLFGSGRTKTYGHSREAHELIIRQQPGIGKVFIGKEKDRKPIDPPPVVQLIIGEVWDPQRKYIHSPYYFMSTTLIDGVHNATTSPQASSALGGTLVSSLHKVKDITNNGDVAFFVFGDLSVKLEGYFKLKFTLFEVQGKEVAYITDVTSQAFPVYNTKTWPGMGESTPLTRMLSDQGIRLRLRKEPRFRLNPQGPASDSYQPRKYSARRSKSVVEPGQDPRRESGASAMTMAPTPHGQEAASDDQELENAGEQQQQQLIASPSSHSPISSHAPQPIAPMASFIANENRKRELSMSSYNSGTPPTAGVIGAGPRVPSQNEPIPKRTRPDEEPNQPAMYGGQYPTPQMQNVEEPRMYHSPNEATQMYPPGQLGPTSAQTQYGRQPTYSHGPPNYMTGGRGGPGGYDFNNEREQTMSMSPAQYRQQLNPMMMGGQEQQFQQRGNLSIYGENPTQQSLLNNPDFTVQQPMYQQMMQQQQQQQQQQAARMRQSMPNHAMMEQGYGNEYDSPPDPTIDPLLAAQSGPQRSQGMMPRMSVPAMMAQPPQYYNQRAEMPMMGPGMQSIQSTPNPEMAGGPHSYGNMYAGQGIGMRGSEPGSGIGFRGQLAPQDGVGFRPMSAQDGVGFREPNQYVSPIPSHHSGDTGTAIASEVGDMGHGHPNN